MTDEKCLVHGSIEEKLGIILGSISRLEQSHENSAKVQGELATSIKLMAQTLEKIEDTNVILERVSGRIDLVATHYKKIEEDINEIYPRLRALESVGCNPRLTKIEARQDKMLLSGFIATSLAIIGGIIKVLWK